MVDGSKVAVVVPAYDEARWIGEVLDTMPPFVDLVVVVDDASRDATGELTRERQRRHAESGRGPRIDLVRRTCNRGVGAAIAVGYRRARAFGADVVAVMAGDGQMAPGELETVLAPVLRGEADYVKGTRLGAVGLWRTMPWRRVAGSVLLSRLTSIALGVPITDSQCGFTAARGALLDRLPLEDLWPRFGYPNDLLGLIVAERGRIVEVPVSPIYRGEHSGLRAWHMLTISWLILRAGARLRVRRVRPSGAP